MSFLAQSQFVQPRFYLWLVGSFAVVALALAAVGIYGVISYSVSQRTRELGVRAALGATQSDSLGLVMRQGALIASLGGAIGLAAALMSMRFAQAFLYDVKPTDALTLGLACGVLAIVAG